MKRYSIFSLVGNALSGHQNWPLAWRNPSPKKQYDVVIIGGGGHGLATAYYLAKEHGLRNVAVLEKGWLGGGNTGRNTTIVRSNYHLDPNAHFYDLSATPRPFQSIPAGSATGILDGREGLGPPDDD